MVKKDLLTAAYITTARRATRVDTPTIGTTDRLSILSRSCTIIQAKISSSNISAFSSPEATRPLEKR